MLLSGHLADFYCQLTRPDASEKFKTFLAVLPVAFFLMDGLNICKIIAKQ